MERRTAAQVATEFSEQLRQLSRLIKMTEQHIPYLLRKAEQIDAYLGH